MLTNWRFLRIAVLLPLLVGCGENQSAPRPSSPQPASPPSSPAESPIKADAPILKVAVMQDGKILVDGKASSLSSLRTAIKKLAEQKGIVYYYREAAQEEPPPVAMEVMQAVIDARLPISLSTRPNFSDTVGLDGKPHPMRPASP
jgi:hypothetical protein